MLSVNMQFKSQKTPVRVEVLGSISINHSLPVPRCGNGTNDSGECGYYRFEWTGPVGM